MMMGFIPEEKTRRTTCQEYVEALEDERRKIQVFERELPLCLHLVTEAIRSYRKQIEGEPMQEISECDEETVSEGTPVLEEFMPVTNRRSRSSGEGEDGEEKKNGNHDGKCEGTGRTAEEKPDWLRSVQLWSQNPEEHKNPIKPTKPIVVEAKKATGAFLPFQREKRPTAPPPAACSPPDTCGGGGRPKGCGGDGKEGLSQSQRKNRRCWSPELHRRFLHALQQLGGSHAATPKQIRELMKVDGLTNDEVKSHLQKYRLHTRRPNPPAQQNTCSGLEPPQFVLVGGIWVPPPPPPPEQAPTASAAAASLANAEGGPGSPPSVTLQLDSHWKRGSGEEQRRGCREDLADSNSPATSSSSLTITNTSPNSPYH